MEIFNLFALAEDHRITREREARFERLRRRRPKPETTVRAAKPRTGLRAASRSAR